MATQNNNDKRSGNHLVSATINKIRCIGLWWRASALCVLAFTPSFGGGWCEASAQVNLTLSSARTTGGTVTAGSSITLKPGFSFTAASSKSLTLKIDATESTPYASGTGSFSSNQNYILTRTYKSDDGNGYMDQIQYFDGLGRPMETVQAGITPSGKDLVAYQEYDGFGRESKAWLPRPKSGNSGAYVSFSSLSVLPTDVYNNDTKPYSYPVYEASPLNRVTQQFGPGQDWQTNGKAVSTAYLTNNATYPCALYEAGTNGLVKKGNYPDASLYVTKITGEEGSVSYEFKDKLGQVVLTRQVNEGVNYDTYYVYDDFGNKRYVLPPLASDALTNNATWPDDNTTLKQYAYVYKYDNRNHCIQKRRPGCDWNYYVYDKADRLALSQDGVQRPLYKWTVYRYDKLGRLLYTSEIQDQYHVSFDRWVSQFSGYALTEDFGVPAPYNPMEDTGYTRGNFWQLDMFPTRLLSVSYYDDYRFLDLLSTDKKSALQYTALSGYGTQYSNAKGLVTGTREYQLNDPTKYKITATYYDYRGRVIQTKSTNHLSGTEAEYIAYDFLGHPTQRKHVHTSTQAGTVTELYAYTYDHAGRLTKTTHKLNSNAEQVLAKITYDELGRALNLKAGNSSVINTTYGYNVRSWTSSITGTHFNEKLNYNYDGNIKQQIFGDNSSYSITYNFVYDDLSRLTDATNDDGSYIGYYDCHYQYDKMGNPTSIYTYGSKWIQKSSSGGTILRPIISLTSTFTSLLYDNLTLTYNGNQLQKVTDSGDKGTASITEQFQDYVNKDVEYTYNANGAMSQDLNKGISSIQYNLLNLPQQIDILSPVGEARNTYSYAADGTKLQVVKKYNSNYNSSPIIGSAVNTSKLNVTKTTDYVGNKIFENNALDRILVDGGYIKNGTYYFYETDHLGDNRTVINQSGSVIERNDYYPYGMQMGHNDPNRGVLALVPEDSNPFKYSNKELDVMHGLNLYDYAARMQDPTLGRFTTVDPLAEKYYSISPYAYCGDNSLRFVDPTGMIFTERSVDAMKYLIMKNSKDLYNNSVKINNLKTEIRNGGLTDKELNKKINQINKLEKANSDITTVQDEISTLSASSQVYDVFSDNSMNTSGSVFGTGTDKSGATFNFSNGNFEVRLGNNSLSMVAHELKHAYQFETGGFSSGFMRDGTPFYDKSDEVEAYNRGAMYGGSRYSINSLPSDYDKLQDGPMDATKLPSLILNSPTELQKLANRTHSAFRVNGVTYKIQGGK